jgi:glycosyltransferase involved in cell wall biosynthesis
MTVLEAMGCGCPVVAYPSDSINEIVGDAAAIVPDVDEHALLEKCLDVARNPEARNDLGTRRRLHVTSHYDITTIVTQLADEYRQIV